MSHIPTILSDPMINELFPDIKPLLEQPSQLGGQDEIYRVWQEHFSPASSLNENGVDYFRGNTAFLLDRIFYGQHFFPGLEVRRNLLHLQMLCSASFSKNYQTQRDGIISYLMAQTYAGGGVLKYKGREYMMKPDDVFLIDCRLPHEYYASQPEGWGLRFFHFDGAQMPACYEQILSSGNVVYTFTKVSRFNDLFKELFLVNRQFGRQAEILTNRILTDMLTEILLCMPQFTDNELSKEVAAVIRYVERHYQEPITLDEISDYSHLSKYHMSRIFTKEMGFSIFTYLKRYRIDVAKRLLLWSDMNINEIADAVGLENHSSLYRYFRELENLSPTEYRKRWRDLEG